jgi:hypothetical protein
MRAVWGKVAITDTMVAKAFRATLAVKVFLDIQAVKVILAVLDHRVSAAVLATAAVWVPEDSLAIVAVWGIVVALDTQGLLVFKALKVILDRQVL